MYNVLVPELRDDPAGIGYAEMSDEQRMAAFYAENQPVRVLAPRWQVKEAIYLGGRWPALLDLQTNENTDLATLARTAVAYLGDGDFASINLDYPMVEAMLDTLHAIGLLTDDMRSAIHKMGDSTTSRAKLLGISPADGHFSSARNMIGGDA